MAGHSLAADHVLYTRRGVYIPTCPYIASTRRTGEGSDAGEERRPQWQTHVDGLYRQSARARQSASRREKGLVPQLAPEGWEEEGAVETRNINSGALGQGEKGKGREFAVVMIQPPTYLMGTLTELKEDKEGEGRVDAAGIISAMCHTRGRRQEGEEEGREKVRVDSCVQRMNRLLHTWEKVCVPPRSPEAGGGPIQSREGEGERVRLMFMHDSHLASVSWVMGREGDGAAKARGYCEAIQSVDTAVNERWDCEGLAAFARTADRVAAKE